MGHPAVPPQPRTGIVDEEAARPVRVTLRYFDGCPNWRATLGRLRAVMSELGLRGADVVLERVVTPEDAERLRFVGSPTVLMNGTDPFADPVPSTSYGLTCRIFTTPEGLAGSPSEEQLRKAINDAR